MIIAQQHSALSGFTYDLLDQHNTAIGSLCWPDIAIARNARFNNPAPSLLSSTIKIEYNGQHYQIAFDYLSREWFNDIRFTLLSEQTVLASADVRHQKKRFKRPTITITEPFTGQLIRKKSLFTVRYDVRQNNVTLGTISEKGWLTVKRKLFIDLPDSISPPVQIFLFFLVHNHALR